LSDNPLFGLVVGTTKHVQVLRYPDTKPFDIIGQAVDSLGLLGKLQGSCREVQPLRGIYRASYRQMEPTHLGS